MQMPARYLQFQLGERRSGRVAVPRALANRASLRSCEHLFSWIFKKLKKGCASFCIKNTEKRVTVAGWWMYFFFTFECERARALQRFPWGKPDVNYSPCPVDRNQTFPLALPRGSTRVELLGEGKAVRGTSCRTSAGRYSELFYFLYFFF